MRRIKVTNFMALKNVEIEIKDFMLVLGEQASGKSTLSKLIYFFRSIDTIIDTEPLLVYAPILFTGQRNLFVFTGAYDLHPLRFYEISEAIKWKFIRYFGQPKENDSFEIIYTYDLNKEIILTCGSHSSSSDRAELRIELSTEDFKSSILLTLEEAITKFEFSTYQSYSSSTRYSLREVFSDPYIPMFIPSTRFVSTTYLDTLKSLVDHISEAQDWVKFLAEELNNLDQEFYDKFPDLDMEPLNHLLETDFKSGYLENGMPLEMTLLEEFLDHVYNMRIFFRNQNLLSILNELRSQNHSALSSLEMIYDRFQTILKGDYTFVADSDVSYLRESIVCNAMATIPIEDSSSGQQEAVRILQDAFFSVARQDQIFRVIEEPEAHLYPLAQKSLVEILSIVLNSTPSQFIVTTHSPYILSIVNNLLFAHRVVAKNPKMRERVQKIIPQEAWLDSEKVSVYFLASGQCTSILDSDLGLIDQNQLDEISEVLGSDFEQLYDLHSQSFHP